jgi:hypothetical protein
MKMKKALDNIGLDKENFESNLDDGITITDNQWEKIAGEIDGRVENFVLELLNILAAEVQEGNWD